MASPYRDGPPTLTLLGQRPGLTWWRAGLAVVVAFVVMVLAWHQVRVDCERGSGVCHVRDVRLVWSEDKTVNVASLTGAAIEGDEANRVVLHTESGPVETSSSAEADDASGKDAMVKAIDDFVRAKRPELHAAYGAVFGWSWFGLLFGGFVIVWGGDIVRVRVLFDADRHIVTVERSLLGLLPRRIETDVQPYRSAELTPDLLVGGKKVARGDVFGLALNSASGERVLLEGWASTRPGPTQALVLAMNAALGGEKPHAAPTSAPTAVVNTNLSIEMWGRVTIVVFLGGAVYWTRSQGGGRASTWMAIAFAGFGIFQMLRLSPRRRLLVYEAEQKVVVEQSVLGLFAKRTAFPIDRVQRVVVDNRGPASTGVALLLTDGHHIGLTSYSNASFGADRVARKAQAAIDASRHA